MNLSEHFTLAEFTRSDVAATHGWLNEPDEDQIENLRALCVEVLQPLRDEFGIIRVNSGFRTAQVNAAVNGSPNSQHMRGEAADVTRRYDQKLAPLLLYAHDQGLPYDQMILYPGSFFVHVSHKRDGLNRRVLLVKEGGQYVIYTPEAIRSRYGNA